MASPDRRARNWTVILAAAAAIAISLWMQTRTSRAPADSRAETPAPLPTPSDQPDPRPPDPEPSVPVASPSPATEVFGAVYEVTIARPAAPPEEEPEPTPIDTRNFDSRDLAEPRLVRRVEPRYPESARRARQWGVVTVEGIINERGEVVSSRVVKSTTEPILNEAALEAVRQWRYQPARLRGQPVRVYVTITVTFRLN